MGVVWYLGHMLRFRTKRVAATYLLWYEHAEVKDADVDAAEVATRMRELREGTLGPRAAASALRDAAAVVDAKTAEDWKNAVAQMSAEQKEVFRAAASAGDHFTAQYASQIESLLSDQTNVRRARKLAARLRALAKRYERRAARR